jgi:hypothetical protein
MPAGIWASPPRVELTTALGVAILGGIKLAKERRAVEGNIIVYGE